MRKHKSVVAILLAVMMIFTFMPAMAFADEVNIGDFVWKDSYSRVSQITDSGAVSYSIDRSFDRTTGLTTAWAVDNNNKKIDGSAVSYYDFTNAEIYLVGDMTNDFYTKLEGKAATIKLKDNTGKSTNTALMTSSHVDEDVDGVVKIKGWKMTYDVNEHLDNDADVNADINVVLDAQNKVAPSTDLPDIIGAPVATKSVKVYGTQGPLYNFYEVVNGKKVLESTITHKYDGTEHSVTIDPREGYTLVVTKYNKSTGKWDPATTPITWKNAGEELKYNATYVPATTALITYYKTNPQIGFPSVGMNYTIATSGVTPTYAWSMGNSQRTDASGEYYYDLTDQQSVDPAALIELKGALNTEDAAEIKAVFDELFEVKVENAVVDSNLQTWTIASKKGNVVETYKTALKSLKKDHEQLFANYALEDLFGITIIPHRTRPDEVFVNEPVAKVAVAKTPNVNTQDDDITFSGVTKKVYKAKKSTKKLAKTKSFKVAAVADSGNKITFSATKTNAKIKINKNTGKITVKKGLKKGTYKITVKAKTAAGNGYKAAKASKTYTIKVK